MNIKESKIKKWLDFYNSKNASLVMIIYNPRGTGPMPYPENKKERIDWALESYRAHMEEASAIDDDRIPSLFPFTGTEIIAEAFGSPVHRDDGMPFALPLINNAGELSKVKTPRLEDSSLMRVFEIADSLRKAEPDALMRLPDIQSPLDIAALVWEKSDFLMAMHEEPEAVRELVSMANSLLTAFLDEWFSRYGKSSIAHYPDYYMPAGLTLSEDEIGAISPEMFETFSLPTLNSLSERYGGIGIHCCANSRHQWEIFKKIKGLRLLNLVQPEDVIDEAYNEFRDFCAQMHLHNTNPRFPNKHSATGKFSGRIVWSAYANSKEEAIEKSKVLREQAAEWMEK